MSSQVYLDTPDRKGSGDKSFGQEKTSSRKKNQVRRRSSRFKDNLIRSLHNTDDVREVKESKEMKDLLASTEDGLGGSAVDGSVSESVNTGGMKSSSSMRDLTEKASSTFDESDTDTSQSIGKKRREELIKTSNTRKLNTVKTTHNQSTRKKDKRTLRNRALSVEDKKRKKGKIDDIDPNIWWEAKTNEEMFLIDMQTTKKVSSAPPVSTRNWHPPTTKPKTEINWKQKLEDYEDTAMKLINQSEQLDKSFYAFPEDDIVVERQKRLHAIFPEEDPKDSYHIKESFEVVSSDYVVVRRNYASYGGAVAFSKKVLHALSTQKEEERHDSKAKVIESRVEKKDIGIESETSIDSSWDSEDTFVDPIKMIQIEDYVVNPRSEEPERDLVEKQMRKESLIPLFGNFRPSSISKEPTDARNIGSPYQPTVPIQLFLDFKGISFGSEGFFREPLWIDLAFYDMEKQFRISESLHFNFNDDIESFADIETQPKSGLFSFSYVNDYIYLVARVSSVFHGDIDESCDMYVKGNVLGEKEKAKWKEDKERSQKQFVNYRQGIAWGAIPVFSKGKFILRETFQDIPLYKMKPLLTDEILFESIDNSEKRPPKSLDGQLAVNAKVYNKAALHIPKLVDYNLYPLPITDSPEEISKKISFDKCVKMAYNFGSLWVPPYPTTSFVNNLYIYPLNINLFAPKGTKYKNIICRLSFMSEDIPDPSKFAMESIYGYKKNLVRTIQLPIVANAKRPNFYDEIKFKLPLVLNDKMNIFFTFSSMNLKGKSAEEFESVIGYSFLPLLQENSLPEDDIIELPIYQNLGKDFIKNQEKYTIIKSDGKNSTIELKIRLASSLHARKKLDTFLKAPVDTIQPNIVQAVTQVEKKELIYHLPLVFNRLIAIVRHNSSPNAQHIALKSLIQIVKIVEDGALLLPYLNYQYNIEQSFGQSDDESFNKLLKHWSTLIDESGLTPENKVLLDSSMNEYPNFYFGLIVKSMVLKLENQKLLNVPDRKARFSKETQELLTKLVSGFGGIAANPVSNAVTQNFISSLALFFNDLFGLMDRGFVATLVSNFMSCLNDKKTVEFIELKIQFFRILTDYEHYFKLILPTDPEVTPDYKGDNHYLADYVLHEIDSVIEQGSNANQYSAMRLLTETLWKHFLDDRHKEPALKRRIVNAYVPQLQYTINRSAQLLQSDETLHAIKEWMLCLTYIIRTCRPEIIRHIWRHSSKEDLIALLNFWTVGLDQLKKQSTEKDALDINFIGGVSSTILEYLELFMEDFSMDLLQKENTALVDRLSNLFLILLKVNTAEDILVNIILSLRHFLFENKSTLFRSQGNMFCTDCLCELFQKCFGDSFKVTVHSISLVYAFFKANFIEVGEILHMKWSATLALSKLDTKYYPRFLFVLEVLLSFAKKDPLQSMISSDWFLHIHDILSRLYRIVQYTIELPETNDPEYKTELFINLSQECHHSVEMRLKWYSALASFHEQSGYWEEAGQCKVFMASLIASYLIKKADTDTSYLPQSSDSCKQVSPNIIWELPLSEKSIFEPVSSLYFHENGYMNTVHSAIDAMVKASMFEEGVELVSILFDLHRVTGKFKKLEELGKMLWELADRAEKAITSNTRLHYNYYRVCMYGPKFKKFNNTKWIYKELPSVRLVDFSERLVKQFTEKFGEDVKVLPNTHDDLQIEPDKHYLQMLAVSPFLDANRLKSKKTLSVWDKQHGINSFAVEAPWGGPNGGKPSDEVSKQWKIRTIYFTPQYFPGYQRRLRVTEEKKDNIGPLECAIDLIESRLELIKVELHISPPNTKTLQIVLQGSIMPQVNSGPKAIMHYFLTTRDGQDSFDQKKIAILKEKLVEFIRLCDFALRLNEKLIDETQKEYQKVLQEHFNQFRTEAASYLQI